MKIKTDTETRFTWPTKHVVQKETEKERERGREGERV